MWTGHAVKIHQLVAILAVSALGLSGVMVLQEHSGIRFSGDVRFQRLGMELLSLTGTRPCLTF